MNCRPAWAMGWDGQKQTNKNPKQQNKQTKTPGLCYLKLRHFLSGHTPLSLGLISSCLPYPPHTPVMHTELAEPARKLSVNHKAAHTFKFTPCVKTRQLAQWCITEALFWSHNEPADPTALTPRTGLALATLCGCGETLAKCSLGKKALTLACGFRRRSPTVGVLVPFLLLWF